MAPRAEKIGITCTACWRGSFQTSGTTSHLGMLGRPYKSLGSLLSADWPRTPSSWGTQPRFNPFATYKALTRNTVAKTSQRTTRDTFELSFPIASQESRNTSEFDPQPMKADYQSIESVFLVPGILRSDRTSVTEKMTAALFLKTSLRNGTSPIAAISCCSAAVSKTNWIAFC